MSACTSVDLIAAARPNFMKVAPLYKAFQAQPDAWRVRLIYTGQHYDENMSRAVFRDLGLPEPDIHPGVGSGSHAEQTAGVMVAYERVCRESPPSWIVVVGDVNSTLACTLVAAKLGVRVAHLEAGLRSRDHTMPEEINRIVTDALADLLWTPSEDADANLRAEGVAPERVCRVGNIMIDSLEMMRPAIERRGFFGELGLAPKGFGVVTLHRPRNVDDLDRLGTVVEAIRNAAQRLKMVFPVHPRTRERLKSFGLLERLASTRGVILLDPLGYVNFMSLVFQAAYIVTDSGGVQEETTYLGIPCITLRENTERPITVTLGTNRLVKLEDLADTLSLVVSGQWPTGSVPDLWDGRTAGRVIASLGKRVC